jgi:hypothetical protein
VVVVDSCCAGLEVDEIADQVGRWRNTIVSTLEFLYKHSGIPPSHGQGGSTSDRLSDDGRRLLLAMVRKYKSPAYEKYASRLTQILRVPITAGIVKDNLEFWRISEKKIWAIYTEYASSVCSVCSV